VRFSLLRTLTAAALAAGIGACAPVADKGPVSGTASGADGAVTATTDGPSEPLPVLDGGLGQYSMGGLLGGSNGDAGAVTGISVKGALLQGPFVTFLERGDVDRAYKSASHTLETQPSGQTRIWRNPRNGHWGTMTPARTYLNAEGRYCREYRQTVTIGGQEHQAGGKACRSSDGVWQVVS
jgi:surface antigen